MIQRNGVWTGFIWFMAAFQWRALVNTVMNLWECFGHLSDNQLLNNLLREVNISRVGYSQRLMGANLDYVKR
jgi:hypothetical protein